MSLACGICLGKLGLVPEREGGYEHQNEGTFVGLPKWDISAYGVNSSENEIIAQYSRLDTDSHVGDNAPYLVTPCGHLFHSECLKEWVWIKMEPEERRLPRITLGPLKSHLCAYCRQPFQWPYLTRCFPALLTLEEFQSTEGTQTQEMEPLDAHSEVEPEEMPPPEGMEAGDSLDPDQSSSKKNSFKGFIKENVQALKTLFILSALAFFYLQFLPYFRIARDLVFEPELRKIKCILTTMMNLERTLDDPDLSIEMLARIQKNLEKSCVESDALCDQLKTDDYTKAKLKDLIRSFNRIVEMKVEERIKNMDAKLERNYWGTLKSFFKDLF